jgi:single-strand DNA-binding protein
MSRSVNKVILVGYLGKAAETRQTPSGTSVSNFDVATARSVKDGRGGYTDQTEWHHCVLWKAENLAQYLTSGQRVYIEGRLQTRTWEDNEGNRRQATQVIAEQVILLGNPNGNGRGRGKPKPNGAGQQRRAPEPQRGAYAGASGGRTDSEF